MKHYNKNNQFRVFISFHLSKKPAYLDKTCFEKVSSFKQDEGLWISIHDRTPSVSLCEVSFKRFLVSELDIG